MFSFVRAFVHKHSLNAHIRTHIGDQQYACNICEKSFIHKYNPSRHERKHHESSNREQVSLFLIINDYTIKKHYDCFH